MLCTNCKKETAVFFYQQNINGKTTSVALCKECSKKFNSPSGSFGFFEPFFKTPSQGNSNPEKVCNLCGLRFNDIRKLGKVGCPECYKTFKSELDIIIRQIHGSAKHCGHMPENSSPNTTTDMGELDRLQKRLSEAITAENYEEAAVLRDAIKEIKGEKI